MIVALVQYFKKPSDESKLSGVLQLTGETAYLEGFAEAAEAPSFAEVDKAPPVPEIHHRKNLK